MKQARGEDYSSEAFSQTNPYQSQIADIAAKLELRPEAIYGAMVEENHGYRQGFLKNWLGDGWTLSHALTHDFMVADYRRAQQAGKLDRHSTWDKINPVLNDIGPFNFKLATAMRLLQNYLDTTPADSDPLELRRYAGNYPQLATDLAAGDAVPEFAGLMLAEAKRYMRAHADPEYWAQLSDAEKDALYLTYYNMGPVTIEERRPKNTLLNQGKYKPAPGLKDAAGKTTSTTRRKSAKDLAMPTTGRRTRQRKHHRQRQPHCRKRHEHRPTTWSHSWTMPRSFYGRAPHWPILWRANACAAIRSPWVICAPSMACAPAKSGA